MRQMDVVVMLHSHLPWVLHHGRWPHGSDWICEAAIDTYLPLIDTLRALDVRNVAAPVTIGFTPVLANQLQHPSFREELEAYFDQRLGFCDEAPASLESTGDGHLLSLVEFWRSRLVRLRLLLHDIGRDIPGEFRRLQDGERLEIMTSAATHAFLPLLQRDESIRLQLSLGAAEHRRIFGRDAEGFWLPECAYRPAGRWTASPNEARVVDRAGIEAFLEAEGFRWVVVDTHMAHAGSPLHVYGALVGGEAEHRAEGSWDGPRSYSPYQSYRVTGADSREVAALVRDPRSSMQVWSRHGGYPGAAAYLEFHKIRWPGGLRLWRVSAPGTDLGGKEPYEVERARAEASGHAAHFAYLLDQIATAELEQGGSVILAPFDTELFGHWWFEGPDFLGDVYARLPAFGRLRATTASGHLDAHASRTGLRLAQGSWGRNGDFTMWHNDRVEWTWPVIREVEERFWSMAPRAVADAPVHAILEQAARAMMLLQSSDWQFIISTGEVGDYAVRRFTGHAADCARLLDALQSALDEGAVDAGVRLARDLKQRDDLFPVILPSIAAAVQDSRLRRSG